MVDIGNFSVIMSEESGGCGMVIIKLAAYILAITVVLTLASRVMWLLFVLFAFRTWNAVLPLDFLSSHVPIVNGVSYFFIILALAIGTYYLVVQLTKELEWVRYVVLLFMTLWVFRNYSLADVFLFKDWLVAHGYWGVEYWLDQLKEVFTAEPGQIEDTFTGIFEEVFGWFISVWEFVKRI
jgi:hypothetical protein